MASKQAIGVAVTNAKSFALIPDEYYWISNDEFEYIPVKYVGAAGDTNGGAHRMCEFIPYNSTTRMKAPSSRIKGRIPAPAEIHLNSRNIKSDLVQNDDVSEPSVLWSLRQRYKQNLIYSSIGSILIAINPYKVIKELYIPENMTAYMLHAADANDIKALSASSRAARDVELQPHIWTIAAQAYKQMRSPLVIPSGSEVGEHTTNKGNLSGGRQAIIISGESGAGKTEATKMCLQYLSAVAHLASTTIGSGTKAKLISTPGSFTSPEKVSRRKSLRDVFTFNDSTGTITTISADVDGTPEDFASLPIEDRVLGTNPLLESFGNAKTARNNNSSRFGKWLEINFARVGSRETTNNLAEFDSSFALAHVTLTGANITEYLLEKSRVVSQATQERNYHIFYQLCADPAMEMLNASSYQFLNQSGSEYIIIEGVDDAEDMKQTKNALRNLGFSTVDQWAVFDTLKAIVSLGNVIFDVDNGGTDCHIKGESADILLAVAKLIGVEAQRLQMCLTIRTITVRGETMNVALDCSQAVQTRNAFAKEIYGRVFSHIVRKINMALQPSDQSASTSITRRPSDLCIGLLDIFGFEIFERNSFEQLCINYANEKLQQYFLAYVIKKEQEVYTSEELNIVQVVPRDNEDVLRLLEGKPAGLLPRLDEEVKLSGNDASYLRKIDRDHNTKADSKSKDTADENRRFNRTIKTKPGHFEIRHFAGLVLYDSDGFVEKNKDKLHDHLESLIQEFSNEAIKKMLQEPKKLNVETSAKTVRRGSTMGAGSGSSDSPTLSARFQHQLHDLMSILSNSSAHFVRCIKPNNTKQADTLRPSLVLQQLRYSGVLEAIQIRKAGFPVRRKHADFWRSYWSLAITNVYNQDIEANYSELNKNSDSVVRAPINSRSKWWRRLNDQDKCKVILDGLNMRAQDEYISLVEKEKQAWLSSSGPFELTDTVKLSIQSKWTLGAYDSTHIMLGRSLVFFKPEALTTLEKEKIRRGMSALLFVQASARRKAALKKFRVLDAGRQCLRDLLREGNKKNQSNIGVLNSLTEFTSHCQNSLGMICSILKECRSLILRLSAVANCLYKVRMMLSYYYPEKYKHYFYYCNHEGLASCETEDAKDSLRAYIAASSSALTDNTEIGASKEFQYDRDLVADFGIMTTLLKEATSGTVVSTSREGNSRKFSIRAASLDMHLVDSNMAPTSGGLMIEAEEIPDLRLKRVELEDRANGLLLLRQAIVECNEDSLRSALRHVGVLNVKYQTLSESSAIDDSESPRNTARRLSLSKNVTNSANITSIIGANFCEKEEKEAQALIKRLSAERVVLYEVSELLCEFHTAYKNRIMQQQSKKTATAEEISSTLTRNDFERNGSDKIGSKPKPYIDWTIAPEERNVFCFLHMEKEWEWFAMIIKTLNENIVKTLADFTTDPAEALSSVKHAKSSVPLDDDLHKEPEKMLVLAPVAVKIFLAFSRIIEINTFWIQKRWQALSNAVHEFWQIFDEIKAIMQTKAQKGSNGEENSSASSTVATEIMERAVQAERAFSEHIRYVRQELDHFYILPLIKECLLLNPGRDILKARQLLFNAELKGALSASGGLEVEREEEAWSLWSAITTLETQCAHWATEKVRLVLRRAKVLSLARLSVNYDHWVDLLRLCEDPQTTDDRRIRHEAYLKTFKDANFVTESTICLGNSQTSLEEPTKEITDLSGETFVINWTDLSLTSVHDARTILKEMIDKYAPEREGSSFKNTSDSVTDLFAIDPYIDVAWKIESELSDMHVIAIHEYSLLMIRDGLTMGETSSYGLPNSASAASLEIALKEIETACQIYEGKPTETLFLLDETVQHLMKKLIRELLCPLRRLIQSGSWKCVLDEFYSGNVLHLMNSSNGQHYSTLEEVQPSNNFEGSNLFCCITRLRAEVKAIAHMAFNSHYILEVLKSLGNRQGRVLTGWAVGTLGGRELSFSALTELISDIPSKSLEYTNIYGTLGSKPIISEELLFLTTMASHLTTARTAMCGRNVNIRSAKDLTASISHLQQVLLPFQNLYNIVELEDEKDRSNLVKCSPFTHLIPRCVHRELHKMTIEWKYFKCCALANEALNIIEDGDSSENFNYIIDLLPQNLTIKPEMQFTHYSEHIQQEIKTLMNKVPEMSHKVSTDLASNGVPLPALLDLLAEDSKTLDFVSLSCRYLNHALKKCEELDASLEHLELDHKNRVAINKHRSSIGENVSDSSDGESAEMAFLKQSPTKRVSIYLAPNPSSPDACIDANETPDARFVLPEYLQQIVRMLYTIKQIREAFANGRWMEVKLAADRAYEILSDARKLSSGVSLDSEQYQDCSSTSGMPASKGAFSHIYNELLMALSHVDNYLLISACEGALLPLAEVVEFSEPHALSISELYPFLQTALEESLVKLKQCMHLCAQIGCATQRSRQLLEAVKFLFELRTIQLNNWDAEEVRTKLIQAELTGLGTKESVTEVLRSDLMSAKMELMNYVLMRKLEEHLSIEQLQSKQGLIIAPPLAVAASEEGTDRAMTVSLNAVLDEALHLAPEMRSVTLAMILPLLHMVSKVHDLAKQAAEATANELSKSSLQNLELEVQLSLYADAVNTFKQRYSSYYGNETSHAFGVLSLMHGIVQRILKMTAIELDIIATHFMVLRLNVQLREAITHGGMRRDMIGNIETCGNEYSNTNVVLQEIQLQPIWQAIARKEKYLTDAAACSNIVTLPDTLVKLFDVAELIVTVRESICDAIRGVTDSKWHSITEEYLPKLKLLIQERPVIESTIEERDVDVNENNTALCIPQEVKEEVQCIELECLHRWVCANIPAVLNEGIPIDTNGGVSMQTDYGKTYPLSAAALYNSRFEHIEKCLHSIRQMLLVCVKPAASASDSSFMISALMPSLLATSLVHTAEMMLPLRRMLLESVETIKWDVVQKTCENMLQLPVHFRLRPPFTPVRSTSQNAAFGPAISNQSQTPTRIERGMMSDKPYLRSSIKSPPPPPPKRESHSAISLQPSIPPPPPRRESLSAVSQERLAQPPPPPRRDSASSLPVFPNIHPEEEMISAVLTVEKGMNRSISPALPAMSTSHIHPCVREELAFLARLANDFIICSHLVKAMHSGNGKNVIDGGSFNALPYGSPGDLNIKAVNTEVLQRALDFSREAENLHGKSAVEPLPDVYFKSPMHFELAALCTRVLNLRLALLLKYEIKGRLTDFFSAQAEERIGIYEMYRVLEAGPPALAANDSKEKPKSKFSTNSPVPNKSGSTGTLSVNKNAPILTYARAMELKTKMDEMTNSALEVHRKVQVLVEDISMVTAQSSPQVQSIVQLEVQFVRADCHFTDVQNSLSDSCIRAVRFYERKSQSTLHDIENSFFANSRRRSISTDSSPPKRTSGPRIGNEILQSPSGSPYSSSFVNSSTFSSKSDEAPAGNDVEEEGADVMLEDINYILHAISSGPMEAQVQQDPTNSASRNVLVQLATFLLKVRDLVFIKGDVDSSMQIIAALQTQHSQVCIANQTAEAIAISNKQPPPKQEQSLMALILRAPYVRMEYQWVYRHITNSYIMSMLRAGLVYKIHTKEGNENPGEESAKDMSISDKGINIISSSDLPNPIAVYQYGSPMLGDSRQVTLRQAIESAEAYINKAMSPHNSMSAGNGSDAPVDIFGNKLAVLDEDKSLQGRRGNLGSLISKMNTSEPGVRKGSRVHNELYTCTDTMLSYCKAVLTLRNALVARDSDTVLVTMKQWVQTTDITKRDGQVAGGFSTSNFLKPVQNSVPMNQQSGGQIMSGSKLWEQLPSHYFQEIKNIFVCHQNDLLVVSLLNSLKDNGIRENAQPFVQFDRKEWEVRHDDQMKRLSTMGRLLQHFDRLQESTRSRRRFSYQNVPSRTDEGEGLLIDCDSDRSEEVALGSTLGNNTGNTFLWDALIELVTVSRLIFAMRRWADNVESSYALHELKVGGSFSISDEESERLLAMGRDIVRGLEDRMPPPGIPVSPEGPRAVGTRASGGPNAPIAPFPLVQRELELARLTVSELKAAQALKRCLSNFLVNKEGKLRQYCLQSFQNSKALAENKVFLADIDPATIDVVSLATTEDYVLNGLGVEVNTTLGSSNSVQNKKPFMSPLSKKIDKGSDGSTAEKPKYDFPRSISIGSSSNCYVTRLFNTVQLIRRLRTALRTKDARVSETGSDDWGILRSALREEGLLDAADIAYFQRARTVLANEQDYVLNRPTASEKDNEVPRKVTDSNANQKTSKTTELLAKCFLFDPVDIEIRLLIEQVQARKNFLSLSNELMRRESWCSVPPDYEEDRPSIIVPLGGAPSSDPSSIDENSPQMIRRRQDMQSLRRLQAAITAAEEARSLSLFCEFSVADGGLPPHAPFMIADSTSNNSNAVLGEKDGTSPVTVVNNQKQLKSVSSKVDTGKTKARSSTKTPMELLLQKEREQHLRARRGKPGPPTLSSAKGASILPALTLPKEIVKLQGPSQRNIDLLLHSARLVARVRELLLEPSEHASSSKRVHMAHSAESVTRSVRMRLRGREANERAAQLVQQALGFYFNAGDVSSVIASRNVSSSADANEKARINDSSISTLAHPLSIPELRCYYTLLNGQHRQIKAIINKLYLVYSKAFLLCNGAASAAKSFTSKAIKLSNFAGGAPVHEAECSQWLLLRPGSQLANDLPHHVLNRIGVRVPNAEWTGIASAMHELQQVLRLTEQAYGRFWYNNTLPKVPGSDPESKHADLGVLILVRNAKILAQEYKQISFELEAIQAASTNGSRYDRFSYASTGSSMIRNAIFNVRAVEKLLKNSLKFGLRMAEDSISLETPEESFDVDRGPLCAAVRHYRRLLRLNDVLLRIEQRIGLSILKKDGQEAAHNRDLARAFILNPSLAHEVLSSVESIGAGMWEHPAALAAQAGLRLRSSTTGSIRLSVINACINGNASIAAGVTTQARKMYFHAKALPLTRFPWLNTKASVLPPNGKVTQAYTRLPPLLAALSVWVNDHFIERIYRPSHAIQSENTATALNSLTACGRSCPVLRDEILLMLISRYDSSESASQLAVWRALLCMLTAFPPSLCFEPYLESWLRDAKAETLSPNIRSFAEHCLQRMHETIFLSGYGKNLAELMEAHVSEAAAYIDAIWNQQGSLHLEAYLPTRPTAKHEVHFEEEDLRYHNMFSAAFNSQSAVAAEPASTVKDMIDKTVESKQEVSISKTGHGRTLLSKILHSDDDEDQLVEQKLADLHFQSPEQPKALFPSDFISNEDTKMSKIYYKRALEPQLSWNI